MFSSFLYNSFSPLFRRSVLPVSVSAASSPSASSSGYLLVQKHLCQFFQLFRRHHLSLHCIFFCFPDIPAHPAQHPSIRILVINTASFIIQKLTFLFHPFLQPADTLSLIHILSRSWHQTVHKACIKKITVYNLSLIHI